MATWDDAIVTWDDAESTWDDSIPATHHVRVYVNDEDITSVVLSNGRVVIRHGRPNSTVQPDPNTAVLSMTPGSDIPMPIVGQSLRVDVNIATAGIYVTQFTGFITDVVAALAADGRTVAQIVAVSSGLGRMGRLKVGAEPWPVEMDGARIAHVLAACASSGVVAGTIDAGTVQFLGRDIDAQNPLELAQKYASEATGMLVDGRDGAVSYHDAIHRDPAAAPMTDVYASEIRTLPQAAMRVGSVMNRVSIGYGQEPQAVYSVEDADSIAAYGPIDVYAGTELAATADATSTAETILRLYAVPRWGADTLNLPLHSLPQERVAILGQLAPADLLRIYDMPEPMPNPFSTWVEGVEDSYSFYEWDRTLLVSDRWMAPVAPGGYEFVVDPFRDLLTMGPANVFLAPAEWDPSGITLTYDEVSETATLHIGYQETAAFVPNDLVIDWPAADTDHSQAIMDFATFHTGETEKPLVVGWAPGIFLGVLRLEWQPYNVPGALTPVNHHFTADNEGWRGYDTDLSYGPAAWSADGTIYQTQSSPDTLISVKNPTSQKATDWEGIESRQVYVHCRYKISLNGAAYTGTTMYKRFIVMSLPNGETEWIYSYDDKVALPAGYAGEDWTEYTGAPFTLWRDNAELDASIAMQLNFYTGYATSGGLYTVHMDYYELRYADDNSLVTAPLPGPKPSRAYGQWVSGRTYPETFDTTRLIPPPSEPSPPRGRWRLTIPITSRASVPIAGANVDFSHFTTGFLRG